MNLNRDISLDFLRRKTPEAPAAFTPAPPRLNLLPPAVRERAAVRRSRRQAYTMVAGAAVVVVGVAGMGVLDQVGLRSQIKTLQSAQDGLNTQLAVYAPVTNVAQQTRALTATVAEQTGGKVMHGDVLAKFAELASAVGTVQNLQLTTGSTSTGCTSTDPFNPAPAAGCLTFTVQSTHGPSGASTLITALQASDMFVDPFIPTISSGSDGGTTLTGSVALTRSASGDAKTTAGGN